MAVKPSATESFAAWYSPSACAPLSCAYGSSDFALGPISRCSLILSRVFPPSKSQMGACSLFPLMSHNAISIADMAPESADPLNGPMRYMYCQ